MNEDYTRPEPGTDAWDAWAKWLEHHADTFAASVTDRREDTAPEVSSLLRRAAREAHNLTQPTNGNLEEWLFLETLSTYPRDLGRASKDRFDTLLGQAVNDADESHAHEQRKEASA